MDLKTKFLSPVLCEGMEHRYLEMKTGMAGFHPSAGHGDLHRKVF